MSACHLDTSGLLCPLPVIRAQDRIKTLAGGDRLTVLATDPGTLQDIPAWCRVHGHVLLESAEQGDTFRFVVEVRR